MDWNGMNAVWIFILIKLTVANENENETENWNIIRQRENAFAMTNWTDGYLMPAAYVLMYVHRIAIENDFVIEFSFRYIKHCFLFDWLTGWMSESDWPETGTDSDCRPVRGNQRQCLIKWQDNGHKIEH